LVEEFKRGMNRGIRRKLMESKNPLGSIKQCYKRATALDQNWRKSRREEERLRGKREKENRRRGSKTGATTKYAMTISVAKETNAFSAGNNRACSNGRDQEDECNGC